MLIQFTKLHHSTQLGAKHVLSLRKTAERAILSLPENFPENLCHQTDWRGCDFCILIGETTSFFQPTFCKSYFENAVVLKLVS